MKDPRDKLEHDRCCLIALSDWITSGERIRRTHRLRCRLHPLQGKCAGQPPTLTRNARFPVELRVTDAVVPGMSERIDAIPTIRECRKPVLTLLSTVLDGDHLTADPAVALPWP